MKEIDDLKIQTEEVIEATKLAPDVESLRKQVVQLANLTLGLFSRFEKMSTAIRDLEEKVQAQEDRTNTAEEIAKAAGSMAGRSMQSQVARDKAMGVSRDRSIATRLRAAITTISETIGYDPVETPNRNRLGIFQWNRGDNERVTCKRRVEAIPGLMELVRGMLPKNTQAVTREAVLQAVAASIKSRKGQAILAERKD